jgi:Cu(I)/Ag(I) efflux system membrane fusion protein
MNLRTNGIIVALMLALPAGYLVIRHTTGTSAQKTAVRYHCPMHPGYISDKPGDCPVCGMRLEQIKEDSPAVPAAAMNDMQNMQGEHEGHGGMSMPAPSNETISGPSNVTVTPQQQQLIGVKTVQAQIRSIARIIESPGKVAYDPELFVAQQEYISALATARTLQTNATPDATANASSLVQASRLRLKQLGLSDDQIDRLGATGSPDKSLIGTGSSNSAWIYASVYQNELGAVRPGQSVRVSAPSVTSGVFKGTVVALEPVVNAETRSTQARIRVEGSPASFKPGVYVTVQIAVPLGRFLTVPTDAVMDTGTRKVVFVDMGNGVYQPREVKTGQRTDEYYAIESGIMEGESVVVGANFLLDSESQLKAASQQSMQGHSH